MANVVDVATRAASFNIVYQMLSRLFTFALNAYILRYVSTDVLGVINVRLMLLYTTTQFLSREPFRRTATGESKSRPWPTINALIWLSVPLSIVVSVLLSTVWLRVLHRPDEHLLPGYSFAVLAIVISVMAEMLAEPIFNCGQAHGYVRLRVMSEGGALLVRCLIMALLVGKFAHQALYLYGAAQLISSLAYVLSMWSFSFLVGFETDTGQKEHPPKRLGAHNFLPSNQLNWELISLAGSFLKQSVVKQLLTEGEKFVMTFFNPLSFSEQGVFELVNNLGNLAARFLLQPIEESAFMVFSQFIDREKSSKQQKDLNLAARTYEHVLKLNSLIGLVILTFGFNFSAMALRIYAGPNFSTGTGPLLMRWQCLYTLIIAVNGITECFSFAAMTKAQLNQFNWVLVGLSVVFLTSAYFLTTVFGAQGFLIANCINMVGRILFSIKFARRYFKEANQSNPVVKAIPNVIILGLLAIAFAILRVTEIKFCCLELIPSAIHLSIGASLFLCSLIAIYFKEKDTIYYIVKSKTS